MSDQQLQKYVKKTDLDAMKTQFMSEGKTWKLIGKTSNRKSPKVVAILELWTRKGWLL